MHGPCVMAETVLFALDSFQSQLHLACNIRVSHRLQAASTIKSFDCIAFSQLQAWFCGNAFHQSLNLVHLAGSQAEVNLTRPAFGLHHAAAGTFR